MIINIYAIQIKRYLGGKAEKIIYSDINFQSTYIFDLIKYLDYKF